jgi:glycosyltransferase involved in cell wall biosynthesis
MDVELIAIRLPGQIDGPDAGGTRAHRTLRAPPAPWVGPTLGRRLLRGLVQYPFDRLPSDCYPRRWPDLREALVDAKPDVVAFYLPYLAHLAEHAPAHVPVIAVLEEGWEVVAAAAHGGPEWKRRWLARKEAVRFGRVYRRVNRRASAVVAISPGEKARFTRTIAPEKIVVIRHGIDTSYFTPNDADDRDIDVLVVGDLRSPRNHVGALSTWELARSAPESADWAWTFVGPVDADVAGVLRGGGASATGVVDDVRHYYARARAVLVPAFTGSGVKTTSIQAWAMRRPLVASPVGAQGLPVRPGENILIGADPQGLVDQLGSILQDPLRADSLADEGRRTAERECDLALLAHRFADLCLETTAARARPTRRSRADAP